MLDLHGPRQKHALMSDTVLGQRIDVFSRGVAVPFPRAPWFEAATRDGLWIGLVGSALRARTGS